jgi:hypothetical protein
MAHKTETLDALDALIAKVETRLALTPDYIELTALRKARAEIDAASHRRTETMVDDQTGERLMLVPTGDFAKKKAPNQLDATMMVLGQAGQPLTISELISRVRAVGGTVGGKHPATNLGSTLSRSDEIVSVRWRGEQAWWFKSKPLPCQPSLLREAAE